MSSGSKMEEGVERAMIEVEKPAIRTGRTVEDLRIDVLAKLKVEDCDNELLKVAGITALRPYEIEKTRLRLDMENEFKNNMVEQCLHKSVIQDSVEWAEANTIHIACIL